MAAEEDGDVFEITDFTTASDWERFIARLEEVLHEWKLVNRDPLPNAVKGKFTEGPWEEKSEEILFADFKFLITYTRLKPKGEAESENRSSREREEADDDHPEDEHKTPTVIHDIISTENDFPSRAHCLCRWYGLQEFLVIQPAPNFSIIETESRAMILQSSASIALSNSNCHVPVFVQLQQKWRKLYSGVAVVPGANVQFEMCHLKKLPSKYQHLDGLLDMFKGKLGCEYISMPPVSVSVRFTYILEDWIHCPWPQLPPDFSSFSEGEVGCSELDVLPFGACEDPVSELHLSCTWPYLSADMIVETSGYSDLDPLQAPVWSVRIQMTEDPQCLLGQYLRAFMDLCGRTETTDEILGRALTEGNDASEKEGGDDITNALQRLTEPNLPYHIPSLGSVVSRATTRLKMKPEEAPIPPKLLNKILLHLFPDATGLGGSPSKKGKGQNSQSKETTPMEETPPPQGSPDRVEEVFSEALKQLKSCSPDTLTYRLAVSFAIINHNHGGLRAIAHLWQEFVLEMRYRWENGIPIPGLGTNDYATSSSSHHVPGAPPPNLGSCLLHQKLQMLNCCIERKMKREAAGYGQEGTLLHEASSAVFETDEACGEDRPDNDQAADGPGRRVGSIGSSSDDDDDEDEFFECEEGDDRQQDEADGGSGGEGKRGEWAETSPKHGSSSSTPSTSSSTTKRKLPSEKSVDSSVSEASFKDAVPMKAEGRLAPMKNLRSLSTREPLFIPVTQEPSPMTEDMLEEQAEVLAKLGSTAQGSQLRARMQSACLLSDMESFKAANPGCCLEDFVRWYSPRDYIEDEEEEGEGEERVGVEVEKEGGGGVENPPQDQGEVGGEGGGGERREGGSTCGVSPPPQPQQHPDVAEGGDGDKEPPTTPQPQPTEPAPDQDTGPQFQETPPKGDHLQAQQGTSLHRAQDDCDAGPQSGDTPPKGDHSQSQQGTSPVCSGGEKPRGRLSQRMQIPGNVWVEVWQSARHVPARRQKRLFDDTKEAEKVLHFLSGLRPGELVLHLMPMLVHASVLKLAEKEDPEVPVLRTLTDQVVTRAVKVTRGAPHPPDMKRYEDVVRMIELAETVSSRAQSLKTKFTKDLLEKGKAEEELHKFVSSLLQHPEVEVRGGAYGPAGNAIHRLFSAAQKAALMIMEEDEASPQSERDAMNEQMRPASTIHDFPSPSAREYILRALIPRPAPYSRVLPQRMYCVVVDGDYRLAGAFCSDTTFQ
ncbi:rab3 GTPase-activating protein catalytic subunit-like [Babylonia areolata]|uniref:rab3 GTPase-activating protein catalytic subunit-like n=1 Tax=Babylonia areolata TaxID=304850 RepID=UPI003FCF411A